MPQNLGNNDLIVYKDCSVAFGVCVGMYFWIIEPRISYMFWKIAIPVPICYTYIHLEKSIPRRFFLKPTVCKYPTTVNNSEIYISSVWDSQDIFSQDMWLPWIKILRHSLLCPWLWSNISGISRANINLVYPSIVSRAKILFPSLIIQTSHPTKNQKYFPSLIIQTLPEFSKIHTPGKTIILISNIDPFGYSYTALLLYRPWEIFSIVASLKPRRKYRILTSADQ